MFYLRLKHPHRHGGMIFLHNKWVMLLRLIEDGKPEIYANILLPYGNCKEE